MVVGGIECDSGAMELVPIEAESAECFTDGETGSGVLVRGC